MFGEYRLFACLGKRAMRAARGGRFVVRGLLKK
jgi:hypothetical protein